MRESAPPNAAVMPTVLNVHARPQLDDEREPGEAERDGDPDPPPDVLLVDEPREERDEERGRELDEERDPDRQVLDRDEVEPLHERDADQAEGDEEEELPPADPKAPGRDDEEEREKEDGRARVADLRELERREAGAEDDLRDAAVDREERRRGRDHRVAEPRLVVRAPLGEQGGGVDHGPAGYPPTLFCLAGAELAIASPAPREPLEQPLRGWSPRRSLHCAPRGVAQPGRALALGARSRVFESRRPD